MATHWLIFKKLEDPKDGLGKAGIGWQQGVTMDRNDELV
jgi:hypothetical protein